MINWNNVYNKNLTEYPRNIKPVRGNDKLDEFSNMSIKKLHDYLYEITYSSPLDYELANEYYQKYAPHLRGACSAFRKGSWLGRNYDWFYTDEIEFIVHITRGLDKKGNTRYASLSVNSSGIYDFTRESIKEDGFLLPFLTVDGINENGVCVELNVLTPDEERYGRTTGTNPGKEGLCELAVSRYILDYATSVDHAIDLLSERNIYGCFKNGFNEEFHFVVADKDKTVILEFVNNKLQIIEPEKLIMTNFYLSGFDGNLITGFEEEEAINPEDTTLGRYACGVERFKIIQDAYDNIESEEDVLDALKSIRYTKTYKDDTNPFWYSELVGKTTTFGDLTIYLPKSEFSGIKAYVQEKYAQGLRDGSTWQTTHSSIYNIPEKTLSVLVQEEDIIYKFNI